jgi:hypothetical protein
VKKLLLLAAAALTMAACSDGPSAPAASRNLTPAHRAANDLTCRSGYQVAYDENGDPYCAPTDGGAASQPLGHP